MSSLTPHKRPRLEEHQNDERETLPESSPTVKTPRNSCSELPLAECLEDFLADGGVSRFRPRPEWYSHEPSLFGKDWDPALNMAVRASATDASLLLLECGASVDSSNVKGVTPLILAAQKGNLLLTRELLRRGARPMAVSEVGTTAALQAAHFGQCELLQELLDMGGTPLMELANARSTTPLMRAAQEGHASVVALLVNRGASVNRRNRMQMTALMLASQRGHAAICRQLLAAGAEIDARTNQDSTSLLLACKRGNAAVVEVLVEAGCDLWIKDSRGRNALDIARRRGVKSITDLIDATVQVDLMQRQARRRRNFEMVRVWHLLQQERAMVETGDKDNDVSIHEVNELLEGGNVPYQWHLSNTQALLRSMTLPAPLVQLVTQFLPKPHLWPRRMGMLTKCSVVDPVATVSCALDLMDEVLEEGGFLEAFDLAKVPPPEQFASWKAFKSHVRLNGRVSPEPSRAMPGRRLDVTMATSRGPANPDEPTFVELRRKAAYLQVASRWSFSLARVLSTRPYNMPTPIQHQLIVTADLGSLTRRMDGRGVHFDAPVAMDLVMMVSRLCSWYWREREAVHLWPKRVAPLPLAWDVPAGK